MDIEVVGEVVEWLRDFRKDPVTFTFHGGEPLLAGAEFYRQALPLLAEGLPHLKPSFAMQTNLWRMTAEIARILAEYNVPIGSSIDGPEAINDAQRGVGYFEKTMRGYAIAREHGVRVSFICTFTSRSVTQKEEIFRFFLDNGFVMKLHPALPSLRSREPDPWALEPQAYGELLVYLLDRSLEHMDAIEIKNIDDLCRCVFTRHGTVCTFADCMANTFAVGPDGGIYPCYRFVGMSAWVMGSVYDHPSQEDLARSEAWKRMQQYKEYVDAACGACRHVKYCRGGCPYNALVPAGGELRDVDPMCPAYTQIFNEISDRLNREMLETSPIFPPFGPRKGKPGIMSIIQKIVAR